MQLLNIEPSMCDNKTELEGKVITFSNHSLSRPGPSRYLSLLSWLALSITRVSAENYNPSEWQFIWQESSSGCPWSKYDKSAWGYMPENQVDGGDCQVCTTACELMEGCTGIECGTDYCSFWRDDACSTEEEMSISSDGMGGVSTWIVTKEKLSPAITMGGDPVGIAAPEKDVVASLGDGSNSLTPPMYVTDKWNCVAKACIWSQFEEGKDWAFKNEGATNDHGHHSCEQCIQKCEDDLFCTGVECMPSRKSSNRDGYCSFWYNEKCEDPQLALTGDYAGGRTCFKPRQPQKIEPRPCCTAAMDPNMCDICTGGEIIDGSTSFQVSDDEQTGGR